MAFCGPFHFYFRGFFCGPIFRWIPIVRFFLAVEPHRFLSKNSSAFHFSQYINDKYFKWNRTRYKVQPKHKADYPDNHHASLSSLPNKWNEPSLLLGMLLLQQQQQQVKNNNRVIWAAGFIASVWHQQQQRLESYDNENNNKSSLTVAAAEIVSQQ